MKSCSRRMGVLLLIQGMVAVCRDSKQALSVPRATDPSVRGAGVPAGGWAVFPRRMDECLGAGRDPQVWGQC